MLTPVGSVQGQGLGAGNSGWWQLMGTLHLASWLDTLLKHQATDGTADKQTAILTVSPLTLPHTIVETENSGQASKGALLMFSANSFPPCRLCK